LILRIWSVNYAQITKPSTLIHVDVKGVLWVTPTTMEISALYVLDNNIGIKQQINVNHVHQDLR
jgi:hypothetical protein